MIRARVVVRGRVQGVAFRASVRSHARSVGAKGWVRNLPDRTVEAVIEGSEDVVEAVVDYCRTGPPAARVEHVEVMEEPATGAFTEFRIER